MLYRKSVTVLTALLALCMTSCSVQKSMTASSRTVEFQGSSVRDSLREEIAQNLNENLAEKEIVTITVERNERGDTVKLERVTDRRMVRDRSLKEEVKVVEKHDTVFVQKTDSVYAETLRQAQGDSEGRKPAWLEGLRWVFWIIVAVGVLVVVIKIFFR